MTGIITVTLNPAIDRVVELTAHGGTQVSSYPAGKGINVSRTLACLGVPSLALGVVGEADAEFFGTIGSRLISTGWVTTRTRTRTNVTTYNTADGTERHERNTTPVEEAYPTPAVVEQLTHHCHRGDIVVLSGSVPHHAPQDILQQLCRRCQDLGARVVIDSSGLPMKLALEARPYMVKCNEEEFEELTDGRYAGSNELQEAMVRLGNQCGVDVVLVSRGGDGAMMYCRTTNCTYSGNITLDAAEAGTLHTVGSGDAMTAGVCATLLHAPQQPEAQLRQGLAAGTANLFTRMPGLIDAAKAEQLAARAKIDIQP